MRHDCMLFVLLQPDEALSDDFLFPMTSRFSYASSPESDLELSPEPRTGALRGRGLVKSSSDPSIATQDDVPSYTAPPPYVPHNVVPPLRDVIGPDQQHEKYPLAPPDRQSVPDLPPRIDRNNKPPRAVLPNSRWVLCILSVNLAWEWRQSGF